MNRTRTMMMQVMTVVMTMPFNLHLQVSLATALTAAVGNKHGMKPKHVQPPAQVDLKTSDVAQAFGD